ncbi:MAG TPA: hypothetical protein VMZ91_07800 [Candidatus Paceibacterota bacterium]|nr:hypothetical protein [Candidatus Paceibacterota bacterium]
MNCPACKKDTLELDVLEENVICSNLNCNFESKLFNLNEEKK